MSFAFYVRLQQHDSDGKRRDLHACVRPECGCAGVFYNSIGGESCTVCVTLSLESLSCETSDVLEAVLTSFRAGPSFELRYVKDGCKRVVKSYMSVVFEADSSRLGGGSWVLRARPLTLTGKNGLACIAACFGSHTCVTRYFEIRTKPSEWLLFSGLADDVTEAVVCDMCMKAAPCNAVLRVIFRKPADAAKDALCAFVRLKDRWSILSVMLSLRLRMPSEPRFRTCVISMLPCLNKMVAEDALLLTALLPEQQLVSFDAPALIVLPVKLVDVPRCMPTEPVGTDPEWWLRIPADAQDVLSFEAFDCV